MRPQRILVPCLVMALFILNLVPSGSARAAPGVGAPFGDYYDQHEGIRVLGEPITGLMQVDGYTAQYFEKGRIEDHRAEAVGPEWTFMYGRLTDELMQRDPRGSVNNTSILYAELSSAHRPEHRNMPPAGFTQGTLVVPAGTFVPYDALLRRAPGYFVQAFFWAYINRVDLFPGGWLHDVGLPMTDAFVVQTSKNGHPRSIWIQGFERTVLTYDPLNPRDWQVERGNIGADGMRVLPTGGRVDLPAWNARAVLPLKLLVRAGQPGDRVAATLRWRDGTTLRNSFVVLRGEDGQGLIIGNLDWINLPAPPDPATQPATIELRTSNGRLLAAQLVDVLSQHDQDTREVKVYWTISGAERVGPQPRRVLAEPTLARAALEELLWGPPAISQVGYGTAIPAPQDVLSYRGRQSNWGPRVMLRKLTIVNGVATADFSRELKAYGGGSLRVKLIRDQITQTLKQFPTVREVRIAIEGQTEAVLEP